MILLSCFLLQSTIVVDDDGGAGVDFTDLPAAVAAAVDGDRLLVRAGSYTHFELVGKGLLVLGEGASTRLEQAGALGMTSAVADIPRGSSAYLEGLELTGTGFGPQRLEVRGGTTRVALRNVTIRGPVEDFSGTPALRVRAAEVALQDCSILGGPGFAPFPSSGGPGGMALSASQGARVLAFGTQWIGGPGVAGYAYAGGGGHALVLDGSRASFAGCSVSGGSGAVAASSDMGSGGRALVAQAGAHARFAGDASALIQSGMGECPPAPAFECDASSRIVVHGLQVWRGPGYFGLCNAELETTGFVTARALPVLTLDGQFTPAGTLTVRVAGGPPLAECVLAAEAWPGTVHEPLSAAGLRRPVTGDWFVSGGTEFLVPLTAAGDLVLSFPATQLGAGFRPFALQARVRLSNGRVALTGGAFGILR